MLKQMKGIITEFFAVRGYGYLKDTENDEYCFYEDAYRPADGLINKGDRVIFEIYSGRGLRAVNIRRE